MTTDKQQRPLIVIQAQFAPDATSRPIGIPIDIDDEWENALDVAIIQVKLAVMRWKIAALSAIVTAETPTVETTT